MVTALTLNDDHLGVISDEVVKALCRVTLSRNSIFISTPVLYPNGSTVVVRIDIEQGGFLVSDDGHGAFIVDTFNGRKAYENSAPKVAAQAKVEFDFNSFYLLSVQRHQLPAAVAIVANASANAVQAATTTRQKDTKVKEIFHDRVIQAFGNKAVFDADCLGASKKWKVDAAVLEDGIVKAVFEFVSPTRDDIAVAHMKLGDIAAFINPPKITIALSDYEKTDPAYRMILSGAADAVIPADSAAESYRVAA